MIKGKLYPIAANGSFQPMPEQRKFKVQATGEFRKPRKGEFFISGAIPEAYLAPHDLTEPYYIGHLVEVKEIQREVLIKTRPTVRFNFRKFFAVQSVRY